MIRQTARQVVIPMQGERPISLQWGEQLNVRPVYVSIDLDGMSDRRVASYVAKYATKGAESAGCS
ncbi:replication initiator [Nonomuraea dietziae]|uniref:replication initiator n=1 Tax=Nonomuraea dietziae TaxID=65515 RepID=UPI00341CF3FA